jgi:exodeoxyribonuclease VII large subunit
MASVRQGGRRLDAAVGGRLRTAEREVAGERRVLERLSPLAQLASARERVGLLLDRATRAVTAAVGERRRVDERLAARLAPTLPGRLARDRARLERAAIMGPIAIRHVTGARASLEATAAALAVLGPQATLDRGYAIVRRADDDRIVRDANADAPPGTRLALRVANGELPATADDR